MRKLIIFLNILFGFIGVFSILLALTSPMLFDSPGSENNNIVWVMFWSAITLPITSLISVVASIIFLCKKSYNKIALSILLIPTMNLGVLITGIVLLQIYCQGNFSCHS